MDRSLKTGLPIAILSAFLATAASAYEPDRAKSNLASDFAECIAYYTISAEGLRRSGAEAFLIDAAEKAASIAFDFGVELSNVEVTGARVELAVKEQTELMHHDYSNFAILINKYGEFCEQLLEHPEDRLQYWLAK